MSLLGFPLYRYIGIDDAESILRAIRETPPDRPIEIILHTPGGLVIAARQVAAALADHPGKVTAVVPHYAMSGGTLIALAADEIVMEPHASPAPAARSRPPRHRGSGRGGRAGAAAHDALPAAARPPLGRGVRARRAAAGAPVHPAPAGGAAPGLQPAARAGMMPSVRPAPA
jgi:hypothetical protein